MRKVWAPPRCSICQGKISCATKHTEEFTSPTQEMARPRTRFGKISESSTHITGPSDSAKQATKPRSPVSTQVELSLLPDKWKPQDVAIRHTAMPAVPNSIK